MTRSASAIDSSSPSTGVGVAAAARRARCVPFRPRGCARPPRVFRPAARRRAAPARASKEAPGRAPGGTDPTAPPPRGSCRAARRAQRSQISHRVAREAALSGEAVPEQLREGCAALGQRDEAVADIARRQEPAERRRRPSCRRRRPSPPPRSARAVCVPAGARRTREPLEDDGKPGAAADADDAQRRTGSRFEQRWSLGELRELVERGHG